MWHLPFFLRKLPVPLVMLSKEVLMSACTKLQIEIKPKQLIIRNRYLTSLIHSIASLLGFTIKNVTDLNRFWRITMIGRSGRFRETMPVISRSWHATRQIADTDPQMFSYNCLWSFALLIELSHHLCSTEPSHFSTNILQALKNECATKHHILNK